MMSQWPTSSRCPSERAGRNLHGRQLKTSALKYDSGGLNITTDNESWGQILASLIKQEQNSILKSMLKSISPPMLELSHLIDTDNLVGFVSKFALGSSNADTVLRNLGDIMVLTATVRQEAFDEPLSSGGEGILMHLLSLSPTELSTIDISEPLTQEEGQEPRSPSQCRTFLLGWALLTELKSQRKPSSPLSSPEPSAPSYYNTVECSIIEILNVPFAVRGSNYGELLVDLLFALHLNRESTRGAGGSSRSTMAMSRPFLPAFPLESSLGYWSKSSLKGFKNLVTSTMQEEDSEGVLVEIELSEVELRSRLEFVTRLLDWPKPLFESVYAQSEAFIQELRRNRTGR